MSIAKVLFTSIRLDICASSKWKWKNDVQKRDLKKNIAHMFRDDTV